MSDDARSQSKNGNSNPIDRLSEKLESIRTVHSMAIIGAEKEAAASSLVKNELIERYRSGKSSSEIPGMVSGAQGGIDHSGLSPEGFDDEISNIDAVLFRINEVPINSRANYAISMNSAFEVFLGELLTFAFTRRPECMMNSSTSLNDQVLVQAILEDRVMETLVSSRVRKIMSEPLTDCAATMTKILGINTSNIKGLKELNLVRNCLVHNDGAPNQDLIKLDQKYDQCDRIMLDEEFLNEQHLLMFRIANQLWIDLTTIIKDDVPVKDGS